MFKKGNILLTGSTGYVGSYLLLELIKSTQLTIYCLLRSKQTENYVDRLTNLLNKFNISTSVINDRVIPIEGDITLTQFGLPDAEYYALCYDIGFVLHAAAYVNLILPYSILYRPNVVGTENIISFCLCERLKPLHFISTSDVFIGKRMRSEHSNMLEHMNLLNEGYGQTKWVAEQLILTASHLGLPCIITRCGNVEAPSTTTINYWNKSDLMLHIIRGVILSHSAPDISWKIELTPVDFISKIIIKLTQDITENYGKIFHLINTDMMECRDLWSLLNELGYNIQIAPYEIWLENMKILCSENSSLDSLQQLLDSILKTPEYLTNDNIFYQRENTEFFIETNDITYPSVNDRLFKLYLSQLAENNYIPQIKRAKHSITSATFAEYSLENKIVWVTGASSGIGYAVAKDLAKNGATVIITARRLNELHLLRNELNDDEKKNVYPFEMDVTDVAKVNHVISHVENNIGHIDAFVNSVGIMYFCKMENVELNDWQEMLRTNCEGALNCIAAILPSMVNRKTGHIINITSDCGRKAFAGLAVYSGTKFFLEGLSSGLRYELSKYNIKVTCIQPGDVETGMHQKSKDFNAMKEFMYNIPYLQAKNIADAVIYSLKQPTNCAVNEILIEPILAPI